MFNRHLVCVSCAIKQELLARLGELAVLEIADRVGSEQPVRLEERPQLVPAKRGGGPPAGVGMMPHGSWRTSCSTAVKVRTIDLGTPPASFTVTRNGANSYAVTSTQNISITLRGTMFMRNNR